MKLELHDDTVCVSGLKELGAANSNAFRDWVRSSLQDGHKNIDIDLSQTTYVDSCGLGALVALHKTACGRKGAVRLLSPQRPVQQILELTRMHRIFQIVQPPAEPPVGSAPQAPALVAVQKSS